LEVVTALKLERRGNGESLTTCRDGNYLENVHAAIEKLCLAQAVVAALSILTLDK
jgi:hypothetical protein